MIRQNDHMRAEGLISAYLDNQVTAEEKQFFERHIASCVGCRAQLEATRSMVAALRAMPTVRAPRSFVLPREMAKQSKRSVFAWYPALRLATVVAAVVFMIVFAGDLLTTRSTGRPASMSLPAAAPVNQALPREQALVVTTTPLPAAPQIGQALAPTAPAPAGVPSASGTALADSAVRSAATVTETTTYSESTAGSAALAATPLPTATPVGTPAPEATAVAAAPPAVKRAAEATPEAGPAAANQQVIPPAAQPVPLTAAEPAAPTIEPLRVIEITLLGLVIVLVVATLVARRKQA